jgi:hypothetical protein
MAMSRKLVGPTVLSACTLDEMANDSRGQKPHAHPAVGLHVSSGAMQRIRAQLACPYMLPPAKLDSCFALNGAVEPH